MQPLSWPGAIYSWLGRRPSWLYMLFYVAMIVIVPFFYVQMPDGFYHANAAREPSIATDRDSLVSWMETHTLNGLIRTLPLQVVIHPDDVIEQQHLFDSLTVTVSEPAADSSVWVLLVCNIRQIVSTPRNRTWFPSRRIHMEFIGKPPHRWMTSCAIYRSSDNSDAANPREDMINLPERPDAAFAATVYRYGKALDGYSGYSTRSYWRMLYFSAITATTVGYGDIVPVQNRSRLLAGAEAVVGVVLVGLFLNALAHEVARKAGRGSATRPPGRAEARRP